MLHSSHYPTRNFQFEALLGDLQQRQDVHIQLQDFGSHVTVFFENRAQAAYLRRKRPDLVPAPENPGQRPSDHRLGTIFEQAYYSSLSFRFDYLSTLSLSPSDCLPEPSSST